MAYKPSQKPLFTVAQQTQGWDTVTGVEVLLAQDFDQFLLWTSAAEGDYGGSNCG